MNRRLNTLLSAIAEKEDGEDAPVMSAEVASMVIESDLAMPGWRLLDARSGWKPCPIGVHCPTLQ